MARRVSVLGLRIPFAREVHSVARAGLEKQPERRVVPLVAASAVQRVLRLVFITTPAT